MNMSRSYLLSFGGLGSRSGCAACSTVAQPLLQNSRAGDAGARTASCFDWAGKMSCMLPSEIRRLLLSQHESIRKLAERVLRATEAGPIDADGVRALRADVEALQIFTIGHIRDEQLLLEPLLPEADAWGTARLESMGEYHKREHAALRHAMYDALSLTDVEGVAPSLRRLIRGLLEHMDTEERTLLSPDVLRDDIVSIGASAG
jgi:hypothetical protein